jgi:cleavage and polyadenylation specificity factor subunit 2
VAPRKLIFVHGSSKDTDHLAHHCYENQDLTNDIYAPSIGQCLDVSSATNLFKITLTDPLVTSLNIAKFGDYELSYISGVVKREKVSTVPDENDENEPEDLESTEEKLVLDVAPSESIRFHKPVMIGDLKLSEFRTLLVSRGFSAEFVSGALIVNGRVIVRKDGRNLKLEGGINADYFSVRRLLYEFHAII